MIKAIIGLGNEGSEYEKTYHNVGALVASFFKGQAEKKNLTLKWFTLEGFMNTIGRPVVLGFMKKNNLKPAECLIVKDDSDLCIGEYKVVKGGGTAGHKGAVSVLGYMEELGYAKVLESDPTSVESPWWLKVGVRDPHEQVRRKAEAFVLKHWSKADEEAFLGVAQKAWDELMSKNLL